MDDQKTSKKSSKNAPSLKFSSSKAQKPLVPPLLQEVGRLAAGVAAVNAGSATGNPRNKCALQPGHSLMDWIRLGSSGKDLTGVGSKAGHLMVTTKELARHSTEANAWLALRGRVYNVSCYLPFHPGGIEEIMKGVGKDATHLFDQIHPWVNYEQILNKCYLGRLAIESDATVEELFGKDLKKPQNDIQKSSNAIVPKHLENAIVDNVLPRFDWIQKTDAVTIIFYTRQFSNAQIEINPPNRENVLNVYLRYEGRSFINTVTFYKGVQWPCRIKTNHETGKVELIFKKLESEIWENYGTLHQRYEETVLTEFKLKYSVINKKQINRNTCLLELERVDNSKVTIPVGKHVRVFAKVKGEEMSRSYTPVPSTLFTKFKPTLYTTDNICLLVKTYPNGNVSKYVCDKNKYDIVELCGPVGSFDLRVLQNRDIFLLLAGGTGLTPMLGLISFLLDRRMRKCQRISLLFFNRAEEDILLKDHFDALEKEDDRFTIEYILSQPSPKWKGLSGHVTSEIVENSMQKLTEGTGYTKGDIYTTVCGPTPFTNLSHCLLKDLGLDGDQVHLFLE